MNQEKLGKFLLALRKEKGLKQKDIANAICVTEQAISKWERGLGCPDIGLWNSICEVYGITLVELLNGEREEKPENEENEKINNLLKDTLEHSNNKISKMEFKLVILLIGLAISIYAVSLILNLTILNYILFMLASIIVIYFLGIIFKKWKYSNKFIIITLILIAIILGYSYLEKISITKNYRRPIFSIKEIYKEYNVTVYNSIFYDAYSCDYTKDEIVLTEDRTLEDMCPSHIFDEGSNPLKMVTLKSGVTITEAQKHTLESFQEELLKFGYVDYNYMREQDLQFFWNYIDENHYCSNNENNSNVVIKRKDGICQYNKDEFYYCMSPQQDGTIKYEQATNRSCN